MDYSKDNQNWDSLSYVEKNHQLYLKQKALLDQFLEKGAISQAQHDKSFHDLIEKMDKRDVPIPANLVDCLREAKEKSISEYVIADKNGDPLAYSQLRRIWNYITVRGTQERTLYKYVNGQAIRKTFKPEPGQKCVNREKIVYCLDFKVTPHILRHTYITNLVHAGVDPKTVQYLAGHENSETTMDIYAKAKYNKPHELSAVVNSALGNIGTEGS